MDPVHLARLRKGEETCVGDMSQEMLFSREPEALFDIVKLLPKRHRLCSFRGRQDLPRLCGYPLFSGQTRAAEAVRVDKATEQNEQDEARKPGNDEEEPTSTGEDNYDLTNDSRRHDAFPSGQLGRGECREKG